MGILKKNCPSAFWLPAPNPVPTRFKIAELHEFGTYIVAIVDYPDCINFEGRKVLLYAGIMACAIRQSRVIDPHFSEEGLSPIARFAPTDIGISLAKSVAAQLSGMVLCETPAPRV